MSELLCRAGFSCITVRSTEEGDGKYCKEESIWTLAYSVSRPASRRTLRLWRKRPKNWALPRSGSRSIRSCRCILLWAIPWLRISRFREQSGLFPTRLWHWLGPRPRPRRSSWAPGFVSCRNATRCYWPRRSPRWTTIRADVFCLVLGPAGKKKSVRSWAETFRIAGPRPGIRSWR